MTPNQKTKWEPLLYSSIGVVAMFLVALALGAIAGKFKVRVDLTEDRLYTLSEGTRAVLKKIEEPITISFYFTQSETEMPVPLKNYARRVADLLDEYAQVSGGRIEVKKFDPAPDSDAEESAKMDGVEGQSLSRGGVISLEEKIYLGLAVRSVDQKVALPFLDPGREKLLEYDLTRAISQVIQPEKSTLGVMSALQVFGQFNPMAMRMGQPQGSEPWIFISELKRDFNVKQVELTAEKIDDDIQVLVVVHPANISERTQYALDQFVLRGGKLIAFLDPLSVVDSQNAMGMQNMMQRAAQGGSNLDKLLKAWGIEYDMSKVVADKTYQTRVSRGEGQVSMDPTWLMLTPDAISRDEPATGDLDSLLLPFAGSFAGSPVAGLTQTVLLKTSATAGAVDRMMAQFGGGTGRDFSPAGKELALAIRLQGRFKTAFPDGKPPGPTESKDEDDDQKGAKKDEPSGESLKESKTEGVVVLVADSDLLFDRFAMRIANFLGQRSMEPMNANLTFLQNLVEQMMGDSNLIKVRSRAVQNRPFTVVGRIQAEADKEYRAKIAELEKQAEDFQRKIFDLQQARGDKGQRVILPKEVQEDIKRLQESELRTKQELKTVRKNLRKDIDSLETRLKWVNIAAMPLLVTLAGMTIAVFKRKKTAAK
jgi:ABC-type uncharacterized transport system involved in gliding motility auxiliary subunit